MDHLWNPTDYAWDSEKLVAARESSGPTSDLSAKDKLPKGSSKRRGKNAPVLICQIEGCTTRLDSPYYRKYRVCPNHAKSPAVVIQGKTVRFCQKCARFHDLGEFDMDRRSCRVRLAEHNRRRREMMLERKPFEHRSSGSEDTSDEVIAPATGATDVSTASVYHTPCSSDRSQSERHLSPPRHRTISPCQLPPQPLPPPDLFSRPIGIDDLLGPLASCLHTMDQLLPAAPQHSDLFIDAPDEGADVDVHASHWAQAASNCAGPVFDEAALDVSDIFDDMDLDLALAGILDPVSDPMLPPPPVYTSPDVVVRMSLKLFACLPSDLPPDLRVELERTTQMCPSMIEGYLRPGCTHLTVDLRLPADQAARLKTMPLEEIIAELAKKLPNDNGLLAQLGKQVVAMRAGQVHGTIDVSGPRGPRLAALSRVCVSVDEAAATRVDLYGANIGRPGDMVLCRQHGRHVTVEMLDSPAWGMVAEDEAEEVEDGGSDNEHDHDAASATGVVDVGYGSSSVRSGASSTAGWEPNQGRTKGGCMPASSVRILGLKCGVAEVEVQAGGAMSAPRPLLVLPDAAAAAEVESLACRARRAEWLDAFLRDAGMVVAHICSEGASARAPADQVEALAARTAAYCAEAGCPALARLLRRAQTALRRSMRTDDTASAMAEGMEGACPSVGKASTKGAIEDDCEGDVHIENLSGGDTALMKQECKSRKGARKSDPTPTPQWDWRRAVGMTFGSLAMAVAARLFGHA